MKNRCNLNSKAHAVNKAQQQLRPESYFLEFFKLPARLNIYIQVKNVYPGPCGSSCCRSMRSCFPSKVCKLWHMSRSKLKTEKQKCNLTWKNLFLLNLNFETQIIKFETSLPGEFTSFHSFSLLSFIKNNREGKWVYDEGIWFIKKIYRMFKEGIGWIKKVYDLKRRCIIYKEGIYRRWIGCIKKQ